ncbi:MAG TPA: ActS/PrrB/RegB family redox-sensitive histidine kinase [Caulobacteraceae bacterium]|jgi:two-component system sensor histidine kinase RegB|uniref:ActS/PrrB/RegB family redox-sensitive histidine kinase n=1 Tax=Phenylobacterium sp. TaxID=1871053 RepID=UPI002C8B32A2|nr:ActS/PrrB/RegB family redox-sensitive histidine kinase [Phenylobacterium sp.]HLZ83560.1 ActS/PrrB/RegB family redox-sensitive histidine kinase [Caulobacteraceae bacterium]HXA41071.1 ActS/PrrB/RegB family redox-sensitive histidine kinase [Phenylobacterium sp.]
MPRSQTSAAPSTEPGLDRTARGDAQAGPAAGEIDGAEAWPRGSVNRGRLRVRTLVTLRWMVVAGEALLLLAVMARGSSLPYALCFAIVGAGAWVNLLTGVASPGQRVFGEREAAAQLSLDILQMGTLVFLTGGTANPFVLLLIAPVTLAAATLPLRPVLILGAMAALISVALAFASLPLPHAPGMAATVPLSFRVAAAVANLAGMALTAGYVRQAALESARMALALDVTQAVLAREQRLSALGALAAAAAHELGTPLATISIVAKELGREAPTAAVKEDAELLVSQAERCREILRRLTETPDAASDEVHERISLRQLVQDVIEPHAGVKGVRVEAIVTGAKGMKTPDIRRLPEIAHAFTSFVENAVDFARSEILLSARFDAETISIEVRDDGPGFAPEVLAKLGEPYVTTRPDAEGSRTGHIGMGLGFFIAKTLLERTGALVTFQNSRPHGAVVSARWPRTKIEAGAL